MAARNIKITIAYDGTNYHGWQIQPDVPTVQQQISDAVERLIGSPTRITGSSRTDSGVHALCQVANLKVDTPVPTENFARALNDLPPEDIAVLDAQEVPDNFNSINSAKAKLYRYHICTAKVRPVLDIRTCWHYPGDFDDKNMNKAASLLVGKKDFLSFASAGDHRTDSVREIFSCTVFKDESWIYIDVKGDGFLYNMVRNIAGTLVEVGRRRWKSDYIKEILEARDRTVAGPLAPARGLCLMKIYY